MGICNEVRIGIFKLKNLTCVLCKPWVDVEADSVYRQFCTFF